MISIKLIVVKDVAIIEADLEGCGQAFSFRAEGKELDICGSRYELSEELPRFRKAVLKLRNGVYLGECDGPLCIAARANA